MSYLNPRVLDLGLNVLDTEATHVYICSSEPSTFAQATSTLALGNKSGISIGAPADSSAPAGRKVTVAAITGGNVTASGTASHYAVVDATNSRLLAANNLQSSQGVTNGNTFSLGAFDVTLPNPA
jgi:hypothetical protein